MQWHLFICYLDDEVSTMNFKNLKRALFQRYNELYHRDGEFHPNFEVRSKEVSDRERHYYFTPNVSEFAQDILETYGAFPKSAPESIENMRKIEL